VKFPGGKADERQGGGGEMHLRIGGVTSSQSCPNKKRARRPGADDLVPSPEPGLAVLRNQSRREIFSLAPGKAAIVVML